MLYGEDESCETGCLVYPRNVEYNVVHNCRVILALSSLALSGN
jgi:hypothetical protein